VSYKKIQNLLEGFFWLIDNGRLMGDPVILTGLVQQPVQIVARYRSYNLTLFVGTIFGNVR